MLNDTEAVTAAIKELDGLADGLDARQAAVVAHVMAHATTIKELAADALSALRAARLDDPVTPIIAPLLRTVHGERATSLDEAPRKVSIPDNAVIGDVPTRDSSEGAEPVKPIRATRKRKPTLAGVARQAVRAGIEVAGYEVRDGSIKVITGKPSEATTPEKTDNNDSNEWDGVLPR